MLNKYTNNENYKNEYHTFWWYFNVSSIFAYVLFSILSINSAVRNYNNFIDSLIGTFTLTFIFGVIFFAIISCSSFALLSSRPQFIKLKYIIILYIIAFCGVVGYFNYNIYRIDNISNDIYCYTTNYETFHLYADCITISDSSNIQELSYEDIEEENICKVCKWHYETSQNLTEAEAINAGKEPCEVCIGE